MAQLPRWAIAYADLPEGIWGTTDYARHVITLARGLTQAQRRCALEHERQHIVRGHVGCQTPREERAVEVAAARMLIDLADLADAMRWTQDRHELAELLWVDPETLDVRLSALTATERERLPGA